MIIGIDPGTTNLGIAVVGEEGNLKGQTLTTKVFNSKKYKDRVSAIFDIGMFCSDQAATAGEQVKGVRIERYVPYAGTFSSDAEGIVLLIGGLEHMFFSRFSETPLLLRAIEWKPRLCKDLVLKKNFSNPSTKFDKKFSKAAATCITGREFKTDHEADAVCLAYYDKI